ncbi:MerR family transcriptional regulator [Streptomonospora alba]|uniref:MerR family transcriptional regulator n=1 Tax=Streptomonospora alba TaxID=183763 RepID=A0A0C2FBD8_9ACTN|nr:MerR family transcriptional regulator [Streptomonospora alba]
MPVARLRTVDLARQAGVSTQQVRNHEAAGVLPPVRRTEAGYRVYDRGHLRALLAFRALAAGFGGERAHAIMRAVHAGDVPLALRLVDEGHADLHDQRVAADAVSGAVGEAAEPYAGGRPEPGPALRVGELAARLGVRASALRVWEAAGLVSPSREAGTRYRSYGPEEVRDARIVRMLRQGGYSFDRIRPVLDELRRTGGTGALRAAIGERRASHDRRARAMLEGAALLYRFLSGDEAGASA